jgi:hypothetical protein
MRAVDVSRLVGTMAQAVIQVPCPGQPALNVVRCRSSPTGGQLVMLLANRVSGADFVDSSPFGDDDRGARVALALVVAGPGSPVVGSPVRQAALTV